MNVYGPMCTTRQVALTTSFVKISSQPSRAFLLMCGCASHTTFAFVPTGGAAPTVGHTIAANGSFLANPAPGGDLYMKATAAGTINITD